MKLKKITTEKERLYYHNVIKDGCFKKTKSEFKKWWIKDRIKKFFHIGFYSKKAKQITCNILKEIANANHEDYLAKTFK